MDGRWVESRRPATPGWSCWLRTGGHSARWAAAGTAGLSLTTSGDSAAAHLWGGGPGPCRRGLRPANCCCGPGPGRCGLRARKALGPQCGPLGAACHLPVGGAPPGAWLQLGRLPPGVGARGGGGRQGRLDHTVPEGELSLWLPTLSRLPLPSLGVEGAVICPLGVADGHSAPKGKQRHLGLVPGERLRQHLPARPSGVAFLRMRSARGRGPQWKR